MIIVLPFSTAYSLIIQPNISYAAKEPEEYPAGSVLPFFIGFSILTLIFADCKPLDFIGENPEAPPVEDKARDLSEQIQSDATRFKRAARQYLRGGNTGTFIFQKDPKYHLANLREMVILSPSFSSLSSPAIPNTIGKTI